MYHCNKENLAGLQQEKTVVGTCTQYSIKVTSFCNDYTETVSHSHAFVFLQNYISHITDLIDDALRLKLPFIYFQQLAALEEKKTQNHEDSVRNHPCHWLGSWRKCPSKTQGNKSSCTGYVSVMALSFAYFYLSCNF